MLTATKKSLILSNIQKDIWLNQTMHPYIPLYNIGGYMDIPTTIDVPLFERAIRHVVRLSDALCTQLIPTETIPTWEPCSKKTALKNPHSIPGVA